MIHTTLQIDFMKPARTHLRAGFIMFAAVAVTHLWLVRRIDTSHPF